MPTHRHPVNVRHYEQATLGERLADRIASGIGSWHFLIIQTAAVLVWVLANIYMLGRHPFDPYPFILLNLLFSVQAAYTGPVLLLAGNRQSQKDRLTLEHTRDEVDKAEAQTAQLLKDITRNTQLTQETLEHAVNILECVEARRGSPAAAGALKPASSKSGKGFAGAVGARLIWADAEGRVPSLHGEGTPP